jgi:hypothetical protein
MTKINARSPFYIKVEKTSMTSVELKLYIYTGTFTANASVSSGTLRYTITKTPLTGKDYVVYEVSELIRDYLDIEFDGSYTSQVVWVNVIATVTGGSGSVTVTPDNTNGYLGFDGYGYFEEGINPALSGTVLQSNNTIVRVNDGSVRLPVYTENTTRVTFLNNGEQLQTTAISSSTNTNAQIQYVALSYNSEDSYKERVLADSGTIEESDCLTAYLNSLDVNQVDEVQVVSSTGTEVLTVKTLECSKYTPYKITFVNKFGALQDMWFSLKSTESLNTKGEQFKSNVINFDTLTYNTYKPQQSQFMKTGKEAITLNTDYIPEENNEVIKQLMMSEQVYLTKVGEQELVLGVIPKTSNVTYKTSLNDRLVQYTIDFDYAFDKINNVR